MDLMARHGKKRLMRGHREGATGSHKEGYREEGSRRQLGGGLEW